MTLIVNTMEDLRTEKVVSDEQLLLNSVVTYHGYEFKRNKIRLTDASCLLKSSIDLDISHIW
jgi:hypothetical protein